MISQPEGEVAGGEWQNGRLSQKTFPDTLAFKDGASYSNLFHWTGFVQEQVDWKTFPDKVRESMKLKLCI
jgi:hypothetical protein